MRRFDGKDGFVKIDFILDEIPQLGSVQVFFDDPEKDHPDYEIPFIASEAHSVSETMWRFLPWLDYEHVEDPEVIPGEFETHDLTVHLSEPAIAFLRLENYFEGLPYSK